MSDTVVKINREQLSLFINDSRTLKSFEAIIKAANETLPADIASLSATVATAIADILLRELLSNKVITIDGSSTDVQYPSAKIVNTKLNLKEDSLPATPATPATKVLDGNRTWSDKFKSSDGSSGISTTITTASLVGKTITVKDGFITGFS
jgi:hypothetical protein